MKALTLHRPWSDAVVLGSKRVENRTWAPPERMLGKYIAIHAGKVYDELGLPIDGYHFPDDDESPVGIVGVARILGVLELRGEKRRARSAFLKGVDAGELAKRLWTLDEDPWWAGPVGWLLDEVRTIPAVPCRGYQKLWTVPEATVAQVRTLWKAAA